MNNAKVIAFYLPQFHPIPENDIWWGKGFTEWTNVGKAKPLFWGHHQPNVPSDLGYYDLRLSESRESQASLARASGIEGFCYWHYWFGNGIKLLERPFKEVLESKKPDFPFCLAWANESWKGFAHGIKNRNMLIEQKYPGEEDYINHFYHVLSAFKDRRYIRVEDKPLFMIYRPFANPDIKIILSLWNKLAIDNGFKGIYFVAHYNLLDHSDEELFRMGFDAINTIRFDEYLSKGVGLFTQMKNKIFRYIFDQPRRYSYKKLSEFIVNPKDAIENYFPTIISNWDHTPRSGKEGVVFTGSTPELFEEQILNILNIVSGKKDEHKLVFLKSWNEWAEGNYVEPDILWKDAYCKMLKKSICK